MGPITRKTPQSSPVVVWYEVYSKEHGRYYYFCRETNESTWILPDDDHPNPCHATYDSTHHSSPKTKGYVFHPQQGNNTVRRGGDSTHERDTRQRRVLLVAGLLLLLLLLFLAATTQIISRVSQNQSVLEPSDSDGARARDGGQNSVPRPEDPRVVGRNVPQAVPEQDLQQDAKKDNRDASLKHDPTNVPPTMTQPTTESVIHNASSTRPTSSLGEDILRSLETHMEETLGVRVVHQHQDPTLFVTTDNDDEPAPCFIPFGYLFLQRCRPASFDAEAFVMSTMME